MKLKQKADKQKKSEKRVKRIIEASQSGKVGVSIVYDGKNIWKSWVFLAGNKL